MLPKLREMDDMMNLSQSTLSCRYAAPADVAPRDLAALHVALRPDPSKV